MTDHEIPTTFRHAITGRMFSYPDREKEQAERAIAEFRAEHEPDSVVRVDYGECFRYVEGEMTVRMMAFRCPGDVDAWQSEMKAGHEAFMRSILGDRWADRKAIDRWVNS